MMASCGGVEGARGCRIYRPGAVHGSAAWASSMSRLRGALLRREGVACVVRDLARCVGVDSEQMGEWNAFMAHSARRCSTASRSGTGQASGSG